MNCRHCDAKLHLSFLDLGSAPPSNAYLTERALREPEVWFPLRLLVCESCWLVQTEDHAGREALFTKDYAYFSSFSSSWLAHAEQYVQKMIHRFALDSMSQVVEVASKDGYLLQYVKASGINCYGIEPTLSTSAAAKKKGIESIERFFGEELARELVDAGKTADLTVANNVLAHVPDINDFVKGFAILLNPNGVATFEFPHLLRMVEHHEFDTVYHEHYSYLSLTAVASIFSENGLSIFDVEELSTHGGSLRVFAMRSDSGKHATASAVQRILDLETRAGVSSQLFYAQFQMHAERVKNELLEFLIDARKAQKRVVAYGAAAKGNTLLNFAGVKSDLLAFVVDKNPAKQAKFMPGSRIPIVDESRLVQERPDFVLLLPWNLKTELKTQLSYIRSWGGKFVTAVPVLEVSP